MNSIPIPIVIVRLIVARCGSKTLRRHMLSRGNAETATRSGEMHSLQHVPRRWSNSSRHVDNHLYNCSLYFTFSMSIMVSTLRNCPAYSS
jgi:hypothetical protein